MIDLLIAIVLIVGAIYGYQRGAIHQILHLAGTIIGLVLAFFLCGQIGDNLSTATGTSSGFGTVMAFVIIALVVPVLLGFVASLATKFMKVLHIGFLNRLLGAVIGAATYGLIVWGAFKMYYILTETMGEVSKTVETGKSLLNLIN